MPSIVDVAREANVAASTVSMVVNKRGRVSDATRKRVQAAIDRLGYTPRRRLDKQPRWRTARLRLAFVYTLEAMVNQSVSNYCHDLVSGAQAELKDTAASLSILRGAEHIKDDAMIQHQLQASELDGIILFGPEARNGYLEYLEPTGIPMVVINRPPRHGRFGCVTVDFFGGGELGAKHLLSLGHQRIAIGCTRYLSNWVAQERYAGVTQYLAGQGLEPVILDLGPELRPAPSPEYSEAFCRAALDAGVTAIFTSDIHARHHIEQLQRLGKTVPGDVSLLGFDHLGVVAPDGRRLTSVGFDKLFMGRTAVRLLRRMVLQPRRLRWLGAATTTYLVKGDTTGPCP